MRQFGFVLIGISLSLALGAVGWAASDQARQLRGQNGLTEYAPPEIFLTGNFVADEVEPGYIFGRVKDFVAARACPTAWLIEDGEKKRIETRSAESGPVEYTLYLEEDCPGKVAYYVFVDRSQANSAQWMEWRKQFHKSKAEPQYGAVKVSLEQAAQNGFPVNAELRFVTIQGDLQMKRPEDILTGELKFQPIYDLKQAKAIGR